MGYYGLPNQFKTPVSDPAYSIHDTGQRLVCLAQGSNYDFLYIIGECKIKGLEMVKQKWSRIFYVHFTGQVYKKIMVIFCFTK